MNFNRYYLPLELENLDCFVSLFILFPVAEKESKMLKRNQIPTFDNYNYANELTLGSDRFRTTLQTYN
jgi:hypothetical protein